MLEDLVHLTRDSARDPGRALQQLRALGLPMSARWMALALLVAISAIMAALAVRMLTVSTDAAVVLLTLPPLPHALLQLTAGGLSAWLIAAGGRAFGGRGDFGDALLVVIWLDFLLLVTQLAELVLVMIFPLFGAALGLAALLVIVWISVQMVKALHGFSNSFLVFVGLMAVALATLIFLTVMAGALGLMPQLPSEVPS